MKKETPIAVGGKLWVSLLFCFFSAILFIERLFV